MTGSDLTVVAVCGVSRCATAADQIVAALREPVLSTPDALLLRMTGCPLRGSCWHESGCLVVVQRCTSALRPVGSATELAAGEPAACARTVRTWLRGYWFLRHR